LNTRYLKIFSVLIVIALIFVARLAYLQLFTDRYALNAANTSIKIEYVIPQRGVFLTEMEKFWWEISLPMKFPLLRH
jgi:cell division protein FtsI/penicillin-binding protein 2